MAIKGYPQGKAGSIVVVQIALTLHLRERILRLECFCRLPLKKSLHFSHAKISKNSQPMRKKRILRERIRFPSFLQRIRMMALNSRCRPVIHYWPHLLTFAWNTEWESDVPQLSSKSCLSMVQQGSLKKINLIENFPQVSLPHLTWSSVGKTRMVGRLPSHAS